jgi:hypothetical protein
MEESREFFEDQLFAPHAYTAVQYVNGLPVCFGSLAEGLDACSWLNPASPVIREVEAGAARNDQTVLFFSEIISNGEKGASHADGVIALHLAVGAATGRRHRILFESTNLSARYVPRLIGKGVADSPSEFTEPITVLDNLNYRYATTSTAA